MVEIKITKKQFESFCFVCIARKDYFWLYNPKPFLYYKNKKHGEPYPLEDSIIKQHIEGKISLGLTLFTDNENVLCGGIDFDVHPPTPKAKEDKIKEIGEEKYKEYEHNILEIQRKHIKEDIPKIKEELDRLGYLFFLNSSGSEGIHLRVYSNQPLNARVMRYFLKDLQERILGEARHEVFPKQDKLDEDTPYGNQMKAALAVHPRTKRLAGMIQNGEILDREESLNFLVEFAKKIPEAKHIEFEITPEIEKKYEKKKLSLEELKKISAEGIPYYCAVFEEVANKQFLSSGKTTKHDYLDGNIYQYANANDRQELLKNYCEIQGRDFTAFNKSEKWIWSCLTIHKYLRTNEGEEIELCKEKCQKCPHFTKDYLPDLKPLLECQNDLEKRDRIIRDILKVKRKADPLNISTLIEQIELITGIKKTELKKQLRYEQEESKKNEINNIPKLLGQISEAEKKILTDIDILSLYDQEFDKKIVNENAARKTVFIFCQGRLLENSTCTSFNLCVSDESGLGKDYVVTNVLKMFEEGEDKDYIRCQKITPELLDALSKKVNWNYKIFYNEDIRNNVLNADTFKTFSSGAQVFYSYKEGEAIKTEIKGKPVMIVTTAKGNSDEELARRYVNSGLTDNVDQTKEIMKRWAKYKAEGVVPEYDQVMRSALKHLQPIKVKIPFATDLVDYFPTNHRIMRTQWNRFLDIIGAVTVLHQYQRQKEGDSHIATWQDYDLAVDILKHLLNNAHQIPLSNTDKKIVRALEELGNRVRISSLEAKTHHTPTTLRNRLMHLADFGLVEVGETTEKENEDWRIKKPTMVFSLVRIDAKDIPKSEQIKVNNVSNVIKNEFETDNALEIQKVICVNKDVCNDINNNDNNININNNNNNIHTSKEEIDSLKEELVFDSNSQNDVALPSFAEIKEKVLVKMQNFDTIKEVELVQEFENELKSLELPVDLYEVLDSLAREGEVFQPKPGVWKVV